MPIAMPTAMPIAYLTGEYPRATDTFIQREVAQLRAQGTEVFTFSIRRPGDRHMVSQALQQERDRTTYLLSPPNLLGLLALLASLLGDHLQLFAQSPCRYLRALALAKRTSQPGFKGLLYQLFYFGEGGILARHLQRRGIPHLHNHIGSSSCTVAMLAAALSGSTYSFTLHGPHIFFEPHRWRIDEKIKQAKFVACISHFCRSQAMVFTDLADWDKLHIVHCGIPFNCSSQENDASQTHQASQAEPFELVQHRPHRKRLLYVGRLAAEKGLPILLQGLGQIQAQHPDLQLDIIGDGADRPALETLTHRLGLDRQVNFLGYQSQGEVRQALQTTDVFVLPSFAEGVPVSLMEAMAAGVPVVSTQIAGVGELVEDGVNGFLVPPGDGASLGDRIAQLLGDAELRSRFGQAGRAKVEREFNLAIEVTKLQAIFTAIPTDPAPQPDPETLAAAPEQSGSNASPLVLR